jgi:hypothetical protein
MLWWTSKGIRKKESNQFEFSCHGLAEKNEADLAERELTDNHGRIRLTISAIFGPDSFDYKNVVIPK